MSFQSFSDEIVGRLSRAIEAVNRGSEVLVVFANCDVEYEGRASGYVGLGDRITICKPDGTLLVHRPTGTDPVNWQPPGSSFLIEDSENGPAIVARRSNPEEVVRVYLDLVYQVARFEAEDSAPLHLSGTEMEMHEYILENPEEIEPGLRIAEHEKETTYGTIDLFGYGEAGHPVLMEVKRRRATLNHVDQLRRYLEDYRDTNPNARGILIAPTASEKVKRALKNHRLEFVQLSEFSAESTNLSSMRISDFE